MYSIVLHDLLPHLPLSTSTSPLPPPPSPLSSTSQSPVEESARVAHVMDKLEKRDKIIAVLQKENEALKVKFTIFQIYVHIII